MNNDSEFDRLDNLLAQPASIADRGFSRRVEQKILKLHSARSKLFLITGLCWLALVFIAASPQAIYADFSNLAMTLDLGSLYAILLSESQSLISSLQQLPTTTLAAALLSVAAVISTAIRV